MVLVTCRACYRHSRREEKRCPFCGTRRSEELGDRMVPDTTARLDRAAAFFFAAMAATGACAKDRDDDGSSAASTAGAGGNPQVSSSSYTASYAAVYGSGPSGFSQSHEGMGGHDSYAGDAGADEGDGSDGGGEQ